MSEVEYNRNVPRIKYVHKNVKHECAGLLFGYLLRQSRAMNPIS